MGPDFLLLSPKISYRIFTATLPGGSYFVFKNLYLYEGDHV